MGTVLYIKASPRRGRSHSIAVADAFIESYLRTNPGDKIKTIDVFSTDLPAFDLPAVNAKYKIIHQQEHSEEDKKNWERIVNVIEEFKSADKYVMAVPMWNFSIPYKLKQYFDIIVQPGYTFGVTEDGKYEGLVTGRPVVIVYSRGGQYEGNEAEAFDMQKKYIEQILSFIGFGEIHSIVVEPMLAAGAEVAGQNQAQAVAKAVEMACGF